MLRRSSLSMAGTLAMVASLPAQPQLVVPLTPPSQPIACVAMPQPAQLTEAQKAAMRFRQPQLEGRRLSRAVRKVRKQLEWHDKLEEAAAAAQEQGRPIVWINALGTLKGFL